MHYVKHDRLEIMYDRPVRVLVVSQRDRIYMLHYRPGRGVECPSSIDFVYYMTEDMMAGLVSQQ